MPVKLSELKDFTEYKDKLFIVNSIDELPDDKYFSTEDFVRANINFYEYSLVIVYQLILGDIVTYQYSWCYDNWEERYQFNTTYDRIKDSEYVDGEIENFTYLRSAILVRRILPMLNGLFQWVSTNINFTFFRIVGFTVLSQCVKAHYLIDSSFHNK